MSWRLHLSVKQISLSDQLFLLPRKLIIFEFLSSFSSAWSAELTDPLGLTCFAFTAIRGGIGTITMKLTLEQKPERRNGARRRQPELVPTLWVYVERENNMEGIFTVLVDFENFVSWNEAHVNGWTEYFSWTQDIKLGSPYKLDVAGMNPDLPGDTNCESEQSTDFFRYHMNFSSPSDSSCWSPWMFSVPRGHVLITTSSEWKSSLLYLPILAYKQKQKKMASQNAL